MVRACSSFTHTAFLSALSNRFVHTPILGTGARVLIAGLPLATVPDVVDAMVYASSVNESGLSLCIDPS